MTDVVNRSTTEVEDGAEPALPIVDRAPYPTILVFGDSITQYGNIVAEDNSGPGWNALLSEAYSGKADILNRGAAGYNSRWALYIFPRTLRGLIGLQNLFVITIFCGTNDASPPDVNTYVPVEEYKTNLCKLVNYVRELHLTPVEPILVTPPPVVAAQVAEWPILEDGTPPPKTPELAATYATACVSTAAMLRCPVVNVHRAMEERAAEDADGDVQKGLEVFFKDGVHFSAEGNKFFADMLIDCFRKFVPNSTPDNMESIYPYWTDIDPDNPSESLGTSPLVD